MQHAINYTIAKRNSKTYTVFQDRFEFRSDISHPQTIYKPVTTNKQDTIQEKLYLNRAFSNYL